MVQVLPFPLIVVVEKILILTLKQIVFLALSMHFMPTYEHQVLISKVVDIQTLY